MGTTEIGGGGETGVDTLMAVDALDSLYQALVATLKGVDGAEWGNRVTPDYVPSGESQPYAMCFWAGGGEIPSVFDGEVEELLITVKCVAGSLGGALNGAKQIKEALRHKGSQQVASGNISGGDDWDIVTVFKERKVHIFDPYQDVKPVWHSGNQYRVRMEAV